MYGCKYEADVIKAYKAEMMKTQCRFVINHRYPWIQVTPDFLVHVICSCCGVKCGDRSKMSHMYTIDTCDLDS